MSQVGALQGNGNDQQVKLNTVQNAVNNDLQKVKDKVEEVTNINKLQDVKAESTGHKAGRIISGILGGLLLAAGIAAAVVATTATFGAAAGILGTVAAFTGITGASIAAGTAGTAGIALITTSALLAPKHAGDAAVAGGGYLSDKEIDLLTSAIDKIDNKHKVSFDENALEVIKEDLRDIKVEVEDRNADDEVDLSFKNTSYYVTTGNIVITDIDRADGAPQLVDKQVFDAGPYEKFVSQILQREHIDSPQINKKNVLLVRKYLAESINTDEILPENKKAKLALNNPKIQKQLAKALMDNFGKYNDEQYTKCLALFIAAIAPVDFDFENNPDVEEDLNNSMIRA